MSAPTCNINQKVQAEVSEEFALGGVEVENSDACVVDSGCTFSLMSISGDLAQYVDSERNCLIKFKTPGNYIHTKTVYNLRLPVYDVVRKRVVYVNEEFAVADKDVQTLFSAASKNFYIGDKCGWIKLKDDEGKEVKARIFRKKGLINLWISSLVPPAEYLNCDEKDMHTSNSAFVDVITPKVCSAFSAKISSNKIDPNLLYLLHCRAGHVRGRKLQLTLKEWGLEVPRRLCEELSCDCCFRNNFLVKKIKKKSANKKSSMFNEFVYQDILDLKKNGWRGCRYLSVVVEESTGYVSLMPLQKKSHAIRHAVKYIRFCELHKLNSIKFWCTDKGTEFLNSDFVSMMSKEGIDMNVSAEYTPESQGIVERMNRTLESLFQKFFYGSVFPTSLWPAIVTGLEEQLNSQYKEKIQSSSNKAVFGEKYSAMAKLVVGDEILFRTKLPLKGEALKEEKLRPRSIVGIYGGSLSNKRVRILVKNDSGFRVYDVHPSRVIRSKPVGFLDLYKDVVGADGSSKRCVNDSGLVNSDVNFDTFVLDRHELYNDTYVNEHDVECVDLDDFEYLDGDDFYSCVDNESCIDSNIDVDVFDDENKKFTNYVKFRNERGNIEIGKLIKDNMRNVTVSRFDFDNNNNLLECFDRIKQRDVLERYTLENDVVDNKVNVVDDYIDGVDSIDVNEHDVECVYRS